VDEPRGRRTVGHPRGEVTLVTPDAKYTVSAGTLSVIPAGVEHYSVNETETPTKLVYTAVGGL